MYKSKHLYIAALLLAPFWAAAEDSVSSAENAPYQAIQIDEGIDRTVLSPREVQALDREVKRIRDAEERARADGVISEGERTNLKRLQNAANRSLLRLKRKQMRGHETQEAIPPQPSERGELPETETE